MQVYGVTDAACNERNGRSNSEAVKAAIDGGMTVVQLREKDADGEAFCREARAVIDVARPRGVSQLGDICWPFYFTLARAWSSEGPMIMFSFI